MSGEHVVHGGIIPEHIRPGARFDVQLPNGRRIPILCPENRRGGDRFLLRPFQVQIPQGIKRGKVFNVEANNRQYRVRCPKGKKAGDMLIIQIPEFPEPGYDSVAAGAAAGGGASGSKPYEVPHSYFLKVEQFDTDQMEVPNDVVCPITQEIMVDPVVAMDGHSYERKAVEQWLSKHKTSPKTNEKLSSVLVIPNHALRARIMDFIDSFGDRHDDAPDTARDGNDSGEADRSSSDQDGDDDGAGGSSDTNIAQMTRKVTATSISDLAPADDQLEEDEAN